MLKIKNTVHVRTLFLTWQQKGKGFRYVVGRIEKRDDQHFTFQYDLNTEDFLKATTLGFNGYPAFKRQEKPHEERVISTFMKRLPPPSRTDYQKYLKSHLLPENFPGDDFELLCHTSAKLPSDGFTLLPDLSSASLPFDYNMEIAGTRYYLSIDKLNEVAIGDKVNFKHEVDNHEDEDAIAVLFSSRKIGNVNRVLSSTLKQMLKEKCVSGLVSRIIPDESRPLIYVLLSVS